MKAGTIVDATIIVSASEDDGYGRWVKHRGKRATHGFKAPVACDADTAPVERIAVTSANIDNSRAGPAALPDRPGEVFAGSAYRRSHFGGAVRAKGGTPRVALYDIWAATRKRRSTAYETGAGRFIASAAGSRRSSAPGNAHSDCDGCDGEASLKPPPRSTSPPSPTTSIEFNFLASTA